VNKKICGPKNRNPGPSVFLVGVKTVTVKTGPLLDARSEPSLRTKSMCVTPPIYGTLIRIGDGISKSFAFMTGLPSMRPFCIAVKQGSPDPGMCVALDPTHSD
jgi:hypothetical protein